jgi:hypothetical protein
MMRARDVARPRRVLLLGLAAALLVPGAYIVAGGLRESAPDPVVLPGPTPSADARSAVVLAGSVPIFVRRDGGGALTVTAVAADGSDVLVRRVHDADVREALGDVVGGRGRLSDYGTVSGSGWLALTTDSRGWPMILVYLGDDQAEPWVVDEASLGGVGARWGPTGLVAALVDWGTLVIADPATRTTRLLPLQDDGLVGGGPSIVWTADGSGIVGATQSGSYEIIPLDGGDPRPGVTGVIDPYGRYGPAMAELRICQPGQACPGGDDGRIERLEPDEQARTIWRPQGDGRALAATFAAGADEYWLSVDRDGGRQIELVHLQGGRMDAVATIGRDPDWEYVGAPMPAPDGSALVLPVGAGAAGAAVLVPLDGAPPTFHTGTFAGFVDRGALGRVATVAVAGPAETLPAVGEAYRLPSLDRLIAAELALNPGRTVLGSASHDAVEGETSRLSFEVTRDEPGAGDAYLDCIGPSSVTLTSGARSISHPCTSAGSSAFTIAAAGPITVSATGDTSWRVVLYSTP